MTLIVILNVYTIELIMIRLAWNLTSFESVKPPSNRAKLDYKYNEVEQKIFLSTVFENNGVFLT